MVQQTTAQRLFRNEWELLKAGAYKKVVDYYLKSAGDKKESVAFTKSYGKEAAVWLGEQGITDYNGFNPKTVTAEFTDVYIGRELDVKVKNFSNLPPVEKTLTKVSEKGKAKLTDSEELIYQQVETVLKQKGKLSEAEFVNWLSKEVKAAVSKVRSLQFQKSQVLFAVAVGQVWFSDFISLDENSMDLDLDNKNRSFSVEMRDVEVKI